MDPQEAADRRAARPSAGGGRSGRAHRRRRRHIEESTGVSLIASAWRGCAATRSSSRRRHHPALHPARDLRPAASRRTTPRKGCCSTRCARSRNPVPGPEPGFPLGADTSGRDFLSRLIVGSRQTLIVGVFATLFGLVGGLSLGVLAGAFGGWVDSLVMRVVDVMLSIPSLLLAVSIAALASQAEPVDGDHRHRDRAGADLRPTAARLDAGPAVQRPRPRGPGPRRQEVARSCSGTCCRTRSARSSCRPRWSSPAPIIDAAALSFLGLGNPDDRAARSGARCSARRRTTSSTTPPWRSGPALCIIVVALGFTLMGESLREALDPKSRR